MKSPLTYLIIPIGIIFLSVSLNAQEFASLEMQYLGRMVEEKHSLPQLDATFSIGKNLPEAYVRYDLEGKIAHLGITLFSDEEKKAIGRSLCNFHERLLLSLLVAKNDAEANQFLKQKKINIQISGVTPDKTGFSKSSLQKVLLNILKDKPRFLAVRNDFDWTTTWEGNNYSLSLTYPADIQLIMGMDKKEIGLSFKQELEEFRIGISTPEPLIVDKSTAVQIRKGIYMLPGDSYFIKAMNSNIYITDDGGNGYSTLFDKRYPEESISNLFIAPDHWVKGLNIHINQKIYDATHTYKKPLEELIAFLKEDYDTFVGIEQCNQQHLNFTVIFRSKNYTFHHLLFVETTMNDVFDKSGPMKGTLYTYIPNSNIKDLYHNQWNGQ